LATTPAPMSPLKRKLPTSEPVAKRARTGTAAALAAALAATPPNLSRQGSNSATASKGKTTELVQSLVRFDQPCALELEFVNLYTS